MQNRRAFFFLLLAVVLGVAAAFTARRWLEEQTKPEPGSRAATRAVTVVRTDVAVGSALLERQMGTVDWPIDFVPQGSFSTPSAAAGRVVRRPLAAGEPVLESSLLAEGARGGLVSVIDPERRAVSVKVDPVIGVAGFIVPGGHVDVLVTIRREGGSGGGQPVSKIVLQDVRVLAIDQKLEEAKGAEPQLVQVVTLEVSPKEAEKLTHATHEGRLQLALRNPSDREIVETQPVSVAELLGAPPRPPSVRRAAAPRRSTTSVEVIKGARVSVESF